MSRERGSVNLLDPPGFVGPFNIAAMKRLQDEIQKHEGSGFLWNEQLFAVILRKSGILFSEWAHPLTQDFHSWYRGYQVELSRGRGIILWPRFNDLIKKDGTAANREMAMYATKEHDPKHRDEILEHLIKTAEAETIPIRPLLLYRNRERAREVQEMERPHYYVPAIPETVTV
jgi:hypothetical protein